MEDAALAGDGQEQTVAPEQQVIPESSQAPEASAPQPVETPAEGEGFQKKINKVTGKYYGEQRRANALQKELDDLKAAQNVQPEAKAPTLEDYDFDDAAFNNANIEYHVKRGISAEAKRIQQQSIANEQADKQATIDRTFEDLEAQYAADNPAYAESVRNLPMFNADALNLIKSAGPEMAEALGNNLELAHEIVNASPMDAAMKIGALSAQLKAAPPKITPSAAPAPIQPITPGGSIAPNSGTSGMTFE